MLYVDIGHVDVRLKFTKLPDHIDHKGKMHETTTMKVTVEFLDDHQTQEWIFISEGTAKCGLGDKFDHLTGQRIALVRALAKTELDRTKRKLIWDAYYEIVGD